MGQNQCGRICPRYSCCIPSDDTDDCRGSRAKVFPGKLRRQRSNVSAAFSFAEVASGRSAMSYALELVNINTATEEELMTLSGINRQMAASIVAYRRQIGAFRRVEDLAVVSGVGATRVECLRGEICVVDRIRSRSGSVSSGVEIDSISGNGSCRSHHRSGSKLKVNVNTANFFQLMKLKFVTQAVAENIITYREMKGPFVNLDELLRVKGIKPSLLNYLRPYLVLRDSSASNGYADQAIIANGIFHKSDDSPVDMFPITSPLSINSVRNGWSATRLPSNSSFRFATWNLDHCGLEKVENPGVREVIAMTILENGIKVVALQGVTCDTVLQKLCDELNSPTLYNVKAWSLPRGRWRHVFAPSESVSDEINHTKEPCVVGFIFDSSFGVKPRDVSYQTASFDRNNNLSVVSLAVKFLIDGVELRFINFSVIRKTFISTEFSLWKDLLSSFNDSKSESNMIFVGEFASSANSEEIWSAFEAFRCCPVISRSTFTDISSDNCQGSACSENVWIGPRATSIQYGFSGVVRAGLSSPWIPNGWKWGGLVSSQCPLLVDFSMNQTLVTS